MQINTILTIITPILSVAAGLGFFGSWMKKHWKTVVADGEAVVTGAEKIGSEIGKGLGWPGLEAVKAPLELQVHSLATDLHKSHIAQVASSVLGTFATELESLSKNETGTAVQFVDAELAKVGIKLDLPEILDSLKAAQSKVTKLRSTEAYINTKKLDASLTALKQVEGSATASTASVDTVKPATANTYAPPA